MATRSTIRTDADILLGADVNISDTEWNALIQTRYSSIYESWPWPRRHRDFTITLVAQTSSTSSTDATVTNASSTVTASGGTPFSGSSGYQIRVGAEPHYYFVNSVTSSTVIVLGDGEGNAVTWARSTASDVTWRLFRTIYTLPSDADGVVSISNGNYELRELDGGRSRLDIADPDRSTSGSDPLVWCYAGENSSGVREIEVWPVPTVAGLLRGQYVRRAPTLSDDADEIGVPRSVIVWAVAADGASMLFAKTGDISWQNRADHFSARYLIEEERYRAMELERTSPPTSIKRRKGVMGGLRGTDFETSHDLDALDVENL